MESIYVLFYWITPIDMYCGEVEKWHLSNKDATNFAMFLFDNFKYPGLIPCISFIKWKFIPTYDFKNQMLLDYVTIII